MNTKSGRVDPLGRSHAPVAFAVGVLLAVMLLAGSAWPFPMRSERPFLDMGRSEGARRARCARAAARGSRGSSRARGTRRGVG